MPDVDSSHSSMPAAPTCAASAQTAILGFRLPTTKRTSVQLSRCAARSPKLAPVAPGGSWASCLAGGPENRYAWRGQLGRQHKIRLLGRGEVLCLQHKLSPPSVTVVRPPSTPDPLIPRTRGPGSGGISADTRSRFVAGPARAPRRSTSNNIPPKPHTSFIYLCDQPEGEPCKGSTLSTQCYTPLRNATSQVLGEAIARLYKNRTCKTHHINMRASAGGPMEPAAAGKLFAIRSLWTANQDAEKKATCCADGREEGNDEEERHNKHRRTTRYDKTTTRRTRRTQRMAAIRKRRR